MPPVCAQQQPLASTERRPRIPFPRNTELTAALHCPTRNASIAPRAALARPEWLVPELRDQAPLESPTQQQRCVALRLFQVDRAPKSAAVAPKEAWNRYSVRRRSRDRRLDSSAHQFPWASALCRLKKGHRIPRTFIRQKIRAAETGRASALVLESRRTNTRTFTRWPHQQRKIHTSGESAERHTLSYHISIAASNDSLRHRTIQRGFRRQRCLRGGNMKASIKVRLRFPSAVILKPTCRDPKRNLASC